MSKRVPKGDGDVRCLRVRSGVSLGKAWSNSGILMQGEAWVTLMMGDVG